MSNLTLEQKQLVNELKKLNLIELKHILIKYDVVPDSELKTSLSYQICEKISSSEIRKSIDLINQIDENTVKSEVVKYISGSKYKPSNGGAYFSTSFGNGRSSGRGHGFGSSRD